MLIGMVGMVLLEVEMRIRMCVREVRESFGISQPGLSLMSGVSQPALSRIERNLREPRLGTLVGGGVGGTFTKSNFRRAHARGKVSLWLSRCLIQRR